MAIGRGQPPPEEKTIFERCHKVPFNIALCCFSISFVLCVLSYGTGFWYESKGEDRLFQRLGLWEACFDGYEHTSDYIGKAYYGCWWIFHKEYYYIRSWILPPWFVGVQTLMTFGLVFEGVGMVLMVSFTASHNNSRREVLTSVIVGLSALCISISVVVFGIMVGEDRTWMPQPDNDRLGWSFGCAVVSAFFAVFACIAHVCHTLTRMYENSDHSAEFQAKKRMPGMDIPMYPVARA